MPETAHRVVARLWRRALHRAQPFFANGFNRIRVR
jgi:hypothetical protein